MVNTVRGLIGADAVFIWFVGRHAEELTFICKITCRKTVVVIGG